MNNEKFYDSIRKTITLTNENVRGFEFLLQEAESRKIPLHKLAYILATTYHETAARMQPIAEYGKGKGRPYGARGKYGQAQYGRGYVQLTWDANYEKADRELRMGGALLKNFDKALEPQYAAPILFAGMEHGWFTGKKLDDFIDSIDESDEEDGREFEGARRIINGVDKKQLISKYALLFEKGLKAAGYGHRATEKPVQPIPDVPAVQVPEKPKASQGPSLGQIIRSIILALFRREI